VYEQDKKLEAIPKQETVKSREPMRKDEKLEAPLVKDEILPLTDMLSELSLENIDIAKVEKRLEETFVMPEFSKLAMNHKK
jgi:hypothetical protein